MLLQYPTQLRHNLTSTATALSHSTSVKWLVHDISNTNVWITGRSSLGQFEPWERVLRVKPLESENIYRAFVWCGFSFSAVSMFKESSLTWHCFHTYYEIEIANFAFNKNYFILNFIEIMGDTPLNYSSIKWKPDSIDITTWIMKPHMSSKWGQSLNWNIG